MGYTLSKKANTKGSYDVPPYSSPTLSVYVICMYVWVYHACMYVCTVLLIKIVHKLITNSETRDDNNNRVAPT